MWNASRVSTSTRRRSPSSSLETESRSNRALRHSSWDRSNIFRLMMFSGPRRRWDLAGKTKSDAERPCHRSGTEHRIEKCRESAREKERRNEKETRNSSRSSMLNDVKGLISGVRHVLAAPKSSQNLIRV